MRRVFIVIVFLLCVHELRATVLLPAEFREIVAGSQIIVYGRIAEVRPEWSEDRRRIDTIVTVEAGSYLKGGPGSTVTFRVPGVRVDARTGRRLVIPPVLMAQDDEPHAVARGDRSRRQLALDAFAATVRAAMAQPGGAR
jgi:hypothetical protein